MPPIPKTPQCEDSTTFNPDTYFSLWADGTYTPPYDNDFRKFILRTFGLGPRDDYGYMAQSAEVTLLQAQTYVEFGAQGGLTAWYRDEKGKPIDAPPPPSAADIAAYTDIFRPTTSTAKALTALASNAKKGSIRALVAAHMSSKYHPPTNITVPKSKTNTNPYFDLWAWTNQLILWAGPEANTVRIKHAHPILPVLYHHFGCVCPSYESLFLIQHLARGRRVLDMGSGNGYWTYMLRRMEPLPGAKKGERKALEVLPIDSGQSEWRTVWVGDTLQADGIEWLKKNQGAKDDVLLLVYPTVGNEFTSKMIRAYDGTTIISAGSQNASGYTAFAKDTIAEWMAREMPEWERVLQIPLPSFAGKDEALFVFEKRTGENGADAKSTT